MIIPITIVGIYVLIHGEDKSMLLLATNNHRW